MKKVNEWIQRAENDFNTVEILLEENSKAYEIICFHCQQCIEKYLKAYLIANNKTFPKIHDLVKLTGLCKEIDDSFSELSESLAELNEYAVAARYPGEIVDIKDVENSYRITKETRKFLKIKFVNK